jgi:hypothetical protein
MLTFGWIQGLCFGLEYTEDEELGFILCLDLGLIRMVWYKDMEYDNE